MDLSIIVPAYNEEKLLASTLQAMRDAAAVLTNHTWELIVCDNNSTDRTALIAAEYAVVVNEPVNQIGRARKTGAAAARGEWLLFIDADSWPSPALMNDLGETMRDAAVLYGGAEIAMENVGRGPRWVIGMWHRIARWRGWAAGSFLFVRAAAFREVGGFSARKAYFAIDCLCQIRTCHCLSAHNNHSTLFDCNSTTTITRHYAMVKKCF